MARAEIAPIFSVRSLVESADLVIAGHIAAVRPTGVSSEEFQGRYYSRLYFEADITVDETIKGTSVPRHFVLAYSALSADPTRDVAVGGLTANDYRVIFLRKTDDGYEFANQYSSSLPGAAQSCGLTFEQESNEDPCRRTLERVLNVLCTNVSKDDKQRALTSLTWDEDSTAAPLLKGALSLPAVSSDPVLRTSILSDLLRWNDLSVLPAAEDDLFKLEL